MPATHGATRTSTGLRPRPHGTPASRPTSSRSWAVSARAPSTAKPASCSPAKPGSPVGPATMAEETDNARQLWEGGGWPGRLRRGPRVGIRVGRHRLGPNILCWLTTDPDPDRWPVTGDRPPHSDPFAVHPYGMAEFLYRHLLRRIRTSVRSASPSGNGREPQLRALAQGPAPLAGGPQPGDGRARPVRGRVRRLSRPLQRAHPARPVRSAHPAPPCLIRTRHPVPRPRSAGTRAFRHVYARPIS